MKYLVLLVVLIVIPLTMAFHGSSANYQIEISNIDYGAGDGGSDNYNLSFSFVDQPVAQVASDNYIIGLGFYHSIVEKITTFSSCFYAADIYMILLVLSWLIFVVCLILDNDILTYISSGLLVVAGIALVINGLCDINDWFTRSLGFITLGVGLVTTLVTWIQTIKEVEA